MTQIFTHVHTTMEPLTSEGKVISNSSITEDPSGGAKLSVIKPKMQTHWKRCHTPGNLLLFSDPLDGTSSDEHSFDKEDMFRSDSDAETISVRVRPNEKKQSFDEQVVCIILSVHVV